MSLRNRKRRQNRAEKKLAPATRLTRFNLETPSRGLRNPEPVRRRDITLPTTGVTPGFVDRQRRVAYAQHELRQRTQDMLNNRLHPQPEPAKIEVDLPRQHPICVQRRERRELLFATGRAGKGGQRPRKRDTIIRCE